MSIRLAATGAAVIVAIVLLGMVLNLSSEPVRLVRDAVMQPAWKVTRANSAHHALVVDIEAQRIDQARHIATEIVDPVRTRGYEEILIYVRPMGHPDGPTCRIQWTPAGGYVESEY